MINLPKLRYIFLLSSFLAVNSTIVKAQLIPDNTLGAESSRIVPNGSINRIDGGALRDTNLFHSFEEFNINNGQSVYFNNPSGVENILTRVTGGNASKIFGTLGVEGAANLFLINPNGIVFGENARLDLGGSFVGTTASGLQFGEQGNFSATNPEAPGLLTVNPNALLFNQIKANAGITNKSTALAELNNGLPILDLKVPDGKSLLLVGGNINISGGQIKAFGGNIELAGLSAPGKVELNFTDSNISLGIPDGIERADVSFDEATVNVRSDNGGEIKIYGRNVDLTRGSRLLAGIDFGLGSPDSQGGNIVIDAMGDATLNDGSFIANVIAPGGFGNAGSINIDAASFKLSNGAAIDANMFGEGNAGDIRITTGLQKVNDRQGFVELRDGASITNNIILGKGKAGDIQITTGSLKISNEAFISSLIYSGQGNTGNIIINAKDTVNFDTGAYALTGVSDDLIGNGNGGDIQVTTGTLSLTNGAELTTRVFQGNAGSVIIEARDTVKLDGVKLDEFFGLLLNSRSGIASELLTGGIGKAGDIQITTGSLFVTNGGLISNSTDGQGNGGNVTINVRDKVAFAGFGGSKLFNSEISSSVASNGVGNGGDIKIEAGELLFKDGGNIRAINGGKGDGGNIFLDARDTITFDSAGENGLLSRADTSTINGNAGFIQVNTGSLFLTNGGQMNSNLFKPENSDNFTNAGDITIEAHDIVKFDGVNSGLNSILAGGVGKGGDIKITTNSLAVINGAEISADTSGRGNGGNITINVRDNITFDGIGSNNFSSGAYTTVKSDAIGDAGIIKLTTDSLFLNNGGLLSTETLGKGDAGEITVNANTFDAVNGGRIISNTSTDGNAGTINLNVKDKITFSGTGKGFRSGIFASTSDDSTGEGGSIWIDPRLMTVENGAEVSVGSDGKGDAGDIELQAGTLKLDNGSIFAQTASTQGGNVNLQLGEVLLLRNGSQISTTAGTAQAGGDGGNININSPFIVALPKENSDITANAFTGIGGNVDIITQGIFGIAPADKPTLQSDITASSETGIQGEISITDPDINPTQGVIELPSGLVDRSDQIAQICPRGINAKKLSEFYITGRGSLPPSPLNLLEGTIELSRLVTLDGEIRGGRGGRKEQEQENKKIVEAQGFMKTKNGEIYLVAQAPTVTPSSNATTSVCPRINRHLRK